MLQNLRLTIVVENSASLNNPYLWAQHGLCILLELDLGTDRIKVLMDSGTTSELALHNADLLNLNLREIDLIVLSHGHYDHTGGLMGILKHMNQKVPVLAHPEVFVPKMKAQPFLKYIGPPFCRAEAEAAGAIMLESSVPLVLAPGVMTTGEIVSKEPFEETNGFWTIKEGRFSPDTIPDDQALIVNIPRKGLVVVAGCAHSGIINTIEHAPKDYRNREVVCRDWGIPPRECWQRARRFYS